MVKQNNNLRKNGVPCTNEFFVGLTIKKMLKKAKKENAFCYTQLHGKPFIVEPDMSFNEAEQAWNDVKSGKTKVAIHNNMNCRSAGEVAEGMEELAKENDFVIGNVNGTIFRIEKGMTARDVYNTIESIRQDNFLRYLEEKGKNYTPGLLALIKDEVYEPHDEALWKSLNANRIVGRSMEETEVYGRVMSHLMKEQKTDKPDAEMLEQTLKLVKKNTNWVVLEANDNMIVGYLMATWKHGEELAHSMKRSDWLNRYRKDLEKYREKPSRIISNNREGNE